MKKNILFICRNNILKLVTIIIPALISCSSLLYSWDKTGWIDNNTYHFKATGEASAEAKDEKTRKKSALGAAILSAQYSIIEKFENEDVNTNYKALADFSLNCYGYGNIVREAIKNGKVILKKYENGTCTIIFEVKKEGLKRMADSFNCY